MQTGASDAYQQFGLASEDSMLQLLGQHSGPGPMQPHFATQPQPLEFVPVFSPSPAGDLSLSLAPSPTAAWSPFVGGQNSFFPPNCPPAPLSCQMAAPGCDVGTTLGGDGSGLCSGGSNTCDSGIMDESALKLFLDFVEDQNRLEEQKLQYRVAVEPDVLLSAPPTGTIFPELEHCAEPPVPSCQVAGPTLPLFSSEMCTPTAARGMRHSLLMPTSCSLQQQQQQHQVPAAITRVASHASLCSYTSTTAVSQQHSSSARAPQPPPPTSLSLAQHSFPAASSSALSTALEPMLVPLDDQLRLQFGLFSPPNALAATGAPSRALSGCYQQQQPNLQQWLPPPPTPTTRAPRYSTSSYASSVSPPPNSVFTSDLLEGLCERTPPARAAPAAQTRALWPDYLPPPPPQPTAVRPAAAGAPEVVVVAAASTPTADLKPVPRRDAPPAASGRQRPLSSSSSSTSRSSGTPSPSASEPQPTPATPQSASAPVSEEVRDRLSSTVRRRLLASGRSLTEAPAPAPAAPDPEVCILCS